VAVDVPHLHENLAHTVVPLIREGLYSLNQFEDEARERIPDEEHFVR
jgi:hypothetical protein